VGSGIVVSGGGLPASVLSLAISSATGLQNSTLNAGDTVSVTVNFNATVAVTGTPRVALNIGGTTRTATVSGTTWSYTLVAQDITNMAQGAETLSATQTDATGNTSSAGTGGSFTRSAATYSSGQVQERQTDVASNISNATSSTAAITVDTTAPGARVTTATIEPTGNAVVQSTEAATAYLVNTSVTVINIASITGAAGDLCNEVSIATANSGTNLATIGLRGGSGSDTFMLDAAMIAALQADGLNNAVYARIDGGSGTAFKDTIQVSSDLNLTTIDNQGKDAIGLITSSLNQKLTLTRRDVIDMSASNAFATTGRHQLLVKGAAGDSVDLFDAAGTTGWTQSGTLSYESLTFNTWNHTSLATVYVQQGMAVI
jgi:hypothetical protein